MTSFLATAAAAVLAVLFLASGIGHLARWRGFRRLLLEHGVLPHRLASPAAVVVPLLELAVGAGAIALLAVAELVPRAVPFALALVLAACFAGYLVRLLRHRPANLGCGCSPLAAPLTLASLAPATAALLASTTGLLAGALPATGTVALLPLLWGTLLGGLLLLLPAAVPAPLRVPR